jgi:hypothetical protein
LVSNYLYLGDFINDRETPVLGNIMSIQCLREIEKRKPICEAVDCNNIGTKRIVLSVGKFGVIELLVCSNCVPKFKEDGKD